MSFFGDKRLNSPWFAPVLSGTERISKLLRSADAEVAIRDTKRIEQFRPVDWLAVIGELDHGP
jgi:hypothetical protein